MFGTLVHPKILVIATCTTSMFQNSDDRRSWTSKFQFLIGGLGWWFGYLGSLYERDCYLGVPLESQTTNPNHQFIIS